MDIEAEDGAQSLFSRHHDFSDNSRLSDYSSPEHSESLITNFETFRIEGGYSDVTLVVDGKHFPCHRVILAAGSRYFKSMFSSGMEECRKNKIDLQQVDSNVFEYVLHFIYTGRVQITTSILQDLFQQAYMFQIEPLVNLCVKFFKENMNESNCLAALMLADTHAHSQLYEISKELACFHFKNIVNDEDFCRLSLQCVMDVLCDRRLRCDGEHQVFEMAIKWLDADGNEGRRKNFRFKILEAVKFPMIRKEYLLDIVSKSPHVMQDEKGLKLYEDAITYHMVPSRRHMLNSFQITPRLTSSNHETAILLGGRLADGLSIDVESFRSDTGEFTSLKPLPFKKRNEFTASVIGNDIYVSGGLRSAEFWKYDSGFETWLRGPSLQTARRRHAMAAQQDSLYVLGGFDEDMVLKSVEKWTNGCSWMQAGSLCHAVENMGFVAHDKHIYLFGGKNNDEIVTNTVQCYDTTMETCTILSQPLPACDMCLGSTVLNKQIYVIGLEGAFRYTPETEIWEILPELICPRDFVSVAVIDEKLYTFGGRRRGAKDRLYTDIIECFDPKKNAWEKVGTIPVPMYSYGCVRIFLNEKPHSD
ncbi:KLHL24_35 [Mytilus coruscus]|uniref:KLHL24_35 n=1 Tax=Mytilus coruscus TaxID=42192 RepID=A0A6J8EEX4_MYTCO|nr:KLHL24_35 [Mytilus coruscus]